MTTTIHDPSGKTLATTDPDGRVQAFDYDVFGRTVRETHTTAAGTVKREASVHDSLGRVIGTADELAGVTRHFTYTNGTPGPTTLRTSYADVVTTATIGADGRETTRVSNLGGAGLTRSSTASDTAGRERGWSVGSTTYVRGFSEAGQLTSWGAADIAGTMTYDPASARKERDELSGGLGAAIDQSYSYTDEGRLSGVKPSGEGTRTTAFDDAGNLTTEIENGVTTTMSYEPNTQRLINRRVGASIVATYTFDGFGQRVAQGPPSNPTSETFTYTGIGRLASYAASSGVSATYAYDAAGQRKSSVVVEGSLTTTTTYTYEGLNLLALSSERSDGTTWSVSYLYDAEGRAYAGIYASDEATPCVFQMVTTDRGDVVELLDVEGNSFASYRYDVWGLPIGSATTTTSAIESETLASEITSRQPLRYAGYCLDEHSGLYYLSARSYDTVTRQFISKDPAKADGEESAYQYCAGEPMRNSDPTGLAKRLDVFGEKVTPAVIALSGAYPRSSICVWMAADTAARAAVKYMPSDGGPGHSVGDRGAFRHAYWNALGVKWLYRYVGWRTAGRAKEIMEEFASAYEDYSPNPAADKKMDLHNNREGRKIGYAFWSRSDHELMNKVRMAVLNGKMRRLKNPSDKKRSKLVRTGM